jgi:hypothetical protein
MRTIKEKEKEKKKLTNNRERPKDEHACSARR